MVTCCCFRFLHFYLFLCILFISLCHFQIFVMKNAWQINYHFHLIDRIHIEIMNLFMSSFVNRIFLNTFNFLIGTTALIKTWPLFLRQYLKKSKGKFKQTWRELRLVCTIWTLVSSSLLCGLSGRARVCNTSMVMEESRFWSSQRWCLIA